MADKHNRTFGLATSKIVKTAHEVFATGLETSFGGLFVPSGVIIINHYSGSFHFGVEHIRILQPIDTIFRILSILPSPCPIDIRAEPLNSNDAIHN